MEEREKEEIAEIVEIALAIHEQRKARLAEVVMEEPGISFSSSLSVASPFGRARGFADIHLHAPDHEENENENEGDGETRRGMSFWSLLLGLGCCVLVGAMVYTAMQSPASVSASRAVPTLAPVKVIRASSGAYSVLGKPTISATFINRVLCTAGSPACGKGQALYTLGVKYGIDPAFALAFFLHESSYGTAGEAQTTLALGNLRCIPNYTCVDTDRGGYAAFASWEEGFQAWYVLIHNLYVAQWGLTTVDQIIPRYAPTADNNDEAAYIASVKQAIDTYRAGGIAV